MTAGVTVAASWQGGYEGRLTVTNGTAATAAGWRVTFTMPAGQTVSHGWNGTFGQQGNQVTVTNASYNGQLSPARRPPPASSPRPAARVSHPATSPARSVDPVNPRSSRAGSRRRRLPELGNTASAARALDPDGRP
ncbi:cellulose binding domain-containing protein [Solwaraspora sp. WMMD406]|uniref:cellulose binding domain-containing protein n=1 Tax=Solwaraspora sp. WMMD406 TaxID=3016095 RepID=UPI0024165E01|nr:cellulose binding domain-containing protein [Solwaraspora sp. WMMD406]MDG4764118.1 cellulose binding domain-containing protein [Solwaraspora sp. WMMD406]